MKTFKHFPDPVSLPKEVFIKRKQRLRQLFLSCALGIAARAFIITAELAGYFFFNSASLLVDAIATLIDVITSVLLLISFRYAARPPDHNHPFGHGRLEPLMGLQLGLFMAFVGCWMFIQQGFHISIKQTAFAIDPRAWLIPFGSMILLEICYRIVMRIAKSHHSPALAADAAHFRIDGVTSLCATIALLTAVFVPQWGHLFDHLGAFTIALLMIGMGSRASWQNLNQILDRVPEASLFEKVKSAAKKVDGVRGIEKIRIQSYGPNAHVDIDIEVDPELSVDKAHVISQKVRVEIQKAWAAVEDVTVHIEPFYPGDH